MARRSVTVSIPALHAAPILLSLMLACSTPKALLRSESRIDPLLDVSRTVYIVTAEDVAAAVEDSSVFVRVAGALTVEGMRNEFYGLAVEELASQLSEQGLTLADNPEDADLVFELYLEDSPAFRFVATGSTQRSLPFPDAVLGPLQRKNIFVMMVWNLGNWVNPVERLEIWKQNIKYTRFLPDSLQPGWRAVLEPPGKTMDFMSRINIYVGLLLSAYGKNITEEHSIRPGPPRKK